MPEVYQTTQGDMWDLIAFKIWGDEKRMHRLMEANPDQAGVVFFPAGVKLCVPDLPEPVKTLPLPPWKTK